MRREFRQAGDAKAALGKADTGLEASGAHLLAWAVCGLMGAALIVAWVGRTHP